MTEQQAKEIAHQLIELRRGLLTAAKACEVLANIFDLCYSTNDYLEIDETATEVDTTK